MTAPSLPCRLPILVPEQEDIIAPGHLARQDGFGAPSDFTLDPDTSTCSPLFGTISLVLDELAGRHVHPNGRALFQPKRKVEAHGAT